MLVLASRNMQNGMFKLANMTTTFAGSGCPPTEPLMDGCSLAKFFPKPCFARRWQIRFWLDLARGDLADAVFVAVRTVEGTVRDGGRIASTDVGTILMRKAFDKANGPWDNGA